MTTELTSIRRVSSWRSKELFLSAAVVLGLIASLGLFVLGLRKSADTYPIEQQLLIVEIQQLELATLNTSSDMAPAEVALSLLRLDIGNRLLLNGGLPGPLMSELTAKVNPLPANVRFAAVNHALAEMQDQLIALQRSTDTGSGQLVEFSTHLNDLYEDLDTKLQTEEQLTIHQAQNDRIQLLVASILLLLAVVGLLITRLNAKATANLDKPRQQVATKDIPIQPEASIDLRAKSPAQESISKTVRPTNKLTATELLRPLVSLSSYQIHGLILPPNATESAARRIEIAQEIWHSLDQRHLSIPIIVGLDPLHAGQSLDLPSRSDPGSQIELGITAPTSPGDLEKALDQADSEGWRTRVLGMTLPIAESLDFSRWTLAAAHIDPELVQPPGPSDDVAAIGRTFSDMGIPVVADELNDSALITTLVRSGVAFGSGHALAEPVSVRDVVDWAQDTLGRSN